MVSQTDSSESAAMTASTVVGFSVDWTSLTRVVPID